MIRVSLFLWALMLLVCCLLPASERVELDRKVGRSEANGVSIEVVDGLAGVRSFDGEHLELWGQAPSLTFELTAEPDRTGILRIDVLNCMPEAELTAGALRLTPLRVPEHAASCRFDVPLQERVTLRIAPPDTDQEEPYAFAVLSDIQNAINRVQDVFSRLNEDEELRFVVSTGDLVSNGTYRELVEFQREMRTLRVPMFSTVGNHEMGGDARNWHKLFGPFNVNFAFKGVHFSLVDSGNATIDPVVYDWLDEWLARAKDRAHVVLTHLPPLDPVGLRGGAFRSRKEGAKFVERLGRGRADALFLGHIHSYYSFSLAGVPSYISGGGGAIEEKLDGIARHYLKVRVRKERIDDVSVVRVDP